MVWTCEHGSEYKVLFRFSIHHITSHLTSPMSNITLAESFKFERWWRRVVHKKIIKVQAVSPANLICQIAVASVQYHFRKLSKSKWWQDQNALRKIILNFQALNLIRHNHYISFFKIQLSACLKIPFQEENGLFTSTLLKVWNIAWR